MLVWLSLWRKADFQINLLRQFLSVVKERNSVLFRTLILFLFYIVRRSVNILVLQKRKENAKNFDLLESIFLLFEMLPIDMPAPWYSQNKQLLLMFFDF